MKVIVEGAEKGLFDARPGIVVESPTAIKCLIKKTL
jgi:hypothetical protein